MFYSCFTLNQKGDFCFLFLNSAIGILHAVKMKGVRTENVIGGVVVAVAIKTLIFGPAHILV